MKKLKLTLALLLTLAILIVPVLTNNWSVFAATTQDIAVNATPAFVTITNAPATYGFGTVAANATANTTNGYFTITNSSTVRVDINIQCDNWSSAGSNWTYGNPGADTANFDASSANGGSGGSTGAGNWDISVLAYSDTLICDNLSVGGDPTWELQLDAPASITHGDFQTNTVTVTVVAE